jgi:hypothetical protein
MLALAFFPAIGPWELIVLAIGSVSLVVPIWGIIDAASRPDKQWEGIGNSKGLWIVLMELGAFLCLPLGLIVSIYYLAVMRPKLEAVGGTSI